MKKAVFFLLLVTVLWGTTFPLQKMALEGISPFVYNAYRFWIATILAFILGGKQNFRFGILLGVFMAAGYVTQTWGLTLTSASKSGFITSLYIVIVPVISFFLERERVNRGQVIGFVLALFGSYLLTGGIEGLNQGDILTIICAFAFAFHLVMITHVSRRIPPRQLLGWQFATVAVINSVLGIGDSWQVSLPVWSVAVYTAVFASVLAVLWQLKYQKEVGSNTSALIFVGEPVFSTVFAFILLGEILTPSQGLGGFLLILALILVSVRPGWIFSFLWYTSGEKRSKRRV